MKFAESKRWIATKIRFVHFLAMTDLFSRARFCESALFGGLESVKLKRDSSFCESKKKQKLFIRIFI